MSGKLNVENMNLYKIKLVYKTNLDVQKYGWWCCCIYLVLVRWPPLNNRPSVNIPGCLLKTNDLQSMSLPSWLLYEFSKDFSNTALRIKILSIFLGTMAYEEINSTWNHHYHHFGRRTFTAEHKPPPKHGICKKFKSTFPF